MKRALNTIEFRRRGMTWGWRALAGAACWLCMSGTGDVVAAGFPAGNVTNGTMRSWILLGPVPVASAGSAAPSLAAQKLAFERDFLSAEGGESGVRPSTTRDFFVGPNRFKWKSSEASRDRVDLTKAMGSTNYAVAYASTELISATRTNFFLGLGSDDAIKVWVNGVLIHEKWGQRALQKADDIVLARLAPGTNQVLVKVQNITGDWGFSAVPLSQEEVIERMVQAAGQGDMDRLADLLSLRIDINAINRAGLRAVQAAEMAGYAETVKFLTARGADADLPWPLAGRLIDSLFEGIIKGEVPGAAVLVAQDGQVLFEEGYGYASLEHGAPVTPQTRFRIGSITKQFTAAAILLLQEAGKLSVTNSLDKFLPDFPRAREVTLHHLLTHTSGIHSYTERPDFFEKVSMEVKPADLIKAIASDPYDFSPGEKWHYNNSGYFLLGQIIEKVSGQTYGAFLRDRIFNVTGMSASGVHNSTDIIENEATGYSYSEGKVKKALDWDMSRAGGAGALSSTVEDLFRWNEAIFAGNLLAPASLKAAFRPVKLKNGEAPPGSPGQGYGYGWITSEFRGLKQISHGGGLHGFSSHLTRFPEENLTVVILANALPGPPAMDPAALSMEIAQIYLWEKMASRPARRTDTSINQAGFERYAGRYDYGQGMILTVKAEEGGLFAQMTGQPQHQIFPRSASEFFWKVVDAQITFVTNQQGAVTKAIHRQGGNVVNALRLPDEKTVQVDPAVFDAYVGKYDYGAGRAILTVTREKNQLYAQLTGQPKYEIFPRGTDEFFWQVVPATVKFARNAEGKVTKAVHQQNGSSFEAPRME